MTLDEIKAAVDAGKSVHWVNRGYIVIGFTCEKTGQRDYLIGWDHGGPRAHYIGLTWQDGVTMNGKESEFYIAE